MKKSVVRTDKAPKASGCYSQAIKVGGFVFTAGRSGVDPRTGKMVPGSIKAQVRQTLESIKAILEEAGTSLDHVVKVNVYLRDLADFKAYDEAYGEYFDVDGPPARTTVPGADLPGDMLVEIDAVAYVPEG